MRSNIVWRNAYVVGLVACGVCFLCGSITIIPLIVRQWFLLFALGEVGVLALMGFVFWRCPHCHHLLPLAFRSLHILECPYCKKCITGMDATHMKTKK